MAMSFNGQKDICMLFNIKDDMYMSFIIHKDIDMLLYDIYLSVWMDL